MIHGDEDQTASPEAARRFAQTFGAVSSKCRRGPQPVRPGMPQLVVREALEFYLAPEPQHSSMPSTWTSSARRCPALSPVSPQNTTFLYIIGRKQLFYNCFSLCYPDLT